MNIENLVKGLKIIVEEVSEGKFTIVEKIPSVKAVEEPEEVEAPVVEENEAEEEPVKEPVEPLPQGHEEAVAKKADELKDKTVAELRTIAREMGLPIRGSKSAILGRIVEALSQQEESEVEQVEEPVEDEPEVPEEVVEDVEDVEEEDWIDLKSELGFAFKNPEKIINEIENIHLLN